MQGREYLGMAGLEHAHLLGGVPVAEVESKRDLFAALGFDPALAFSKRDNVLTYYDFSSALPDRAAIRALVELGFTVPNDVSVVGYDDTPHGAGFLPPLSTVRQNWQEGGMLLARKVLALIDGQPVASQMLPTNLVVRAT